MKDGEMILYLIKNEKERLRQIIRDYEAYLETQYYQIYQIDQTLYRR
jgi:hypothetical protein